MVWNMAGTYVRTYVRTRVYIYNRWALSTSTSVSRQPCSCTDDASIAVVVFRAFVSPPMRMSGDLEVLVTAPGQSRAYDQLQPGLRIR
jgi:hypothetical protein